MLKRNSMHCIICNNDINNQFFKIKELQIGLGDEFDYQLCSECGSMQLLNPPDDLSHYYPNEKYYSFQLEMKELKRTFLTSTQASYVLYGKNKLLGRIFSIGYKIPEPLQWMINAKSYPADAILDVGCGNGSLLTKLYKIGFSRLTGIDPFINDNYNYGPIKIYKKEIYDVNEKFEVIMMHHSLEHMSDPLKVLRKAWALLNNGGRLLIRIPVMGNYGWQTYKNYWCGVDAPRHIFIPSEKGMRMLINQAGFALDKIEYDSSDYVIWSSEQYLKGISLHAPNSRMQGKKNSVFSKREIKRFKEIIHRENKKNNGDTAAFYLTREN